MTIPRALRKQKLAKLMADNGFDDLTAMCAASITDAVSPGICAAEDCDYTTDEIEHDQRAGYCEACGRSTVISALVMAGII
jgi:hypothetical protein